MVGQNSFERSDSLNNAVCKVHSFPKGRVGGKVRRKKKKKDHTSSMSPRLTLTTAIYCSEVSVWYGGVRYSYSGVLCY